MIFWRPSLGFRPFIRILNFFFPLIPTWLRLSFHVGVAITTYLNGVGFVMGQAIFSGFFIDARYTCLAIVRCGGLIYI